MFDWLDSHPQILSDFVAWIMVIGGALVVFALGAFIGWTVMWLAS